MLNIAAPALTIAAALMTSSNLGPRVTGWGFVVFTVGSLAWLALGLVTGQASLLWMNAVLTALNLWGIWRWLGRQARFADGAEAAQRDSQARAGPDLFPVSLLTGGSIGAPDGSTLGEPIDAMASARDGRIAYVVVSRGGVGGVGETLHRLDWRDCRVEEGSLAAPIDADALARCPTLSRADWPGR